MEGIITDVLDRFAPPSRVCSVSKPWWNQDIKEARTRAGRSKRTYRAGRIRWEDVKGEEGCLYRTIRRSKRRSWNDWVQKPDERDK